MIRYGGNSTTRTSLRKCKGGDALPKGAHRSHGSAIGRAAHIGHEKTLTATGALIYFVSYRFDDVL